MAFLQVFEGSSTKRGLFLVILGCLAGVAVGYATVTRAVATACSLYTAETPVPSGYGMPYNVFTQTKELLLQATCDGTNVTIQAGTGSSDQYIYKYGYEWRTNSWRQIIYSGTNVVAGSNWLLGQGISHLSRTNTEMAINNYVVGYICQKVNDSSTKGWKCGCRDTTCTSSTWQVQGFTKPSEKGLPDVWSGYDELMVAYASKYTALPGASISLTGSGFSTASNTIWFGNRQIPNIKASTKNSITFTIPSDAQPGLTKIGIENDKGRTATSAQVMITRPGAVPPTVASISPISGKFGTTVTINGTGFTPTGNYLLASYSLIEGIASPDGKTLTFAVRPFPNDPMWTMSSTTALVNVPIKFYFYVMNTNGISAQPLTFTMQGR